MKRSVKKIVVINIVIISLIIVGTYFYKRPRSVFESKASIPSFNQFSSSTKEYYQKGVYPKEGRVISIGDLHGDLNVTISILKRCKLIDNNLDWIGGRTHLVQMGDILDRKIRAYDTKEDEDSEYDILNLMLQLMEQSRQSGGGVHCILGNHELMNIMGDFGYVSPESMKHFKDGPVGRKQFFKPGGKMCQLFANYWNPVVIIGKYLFCHGGMSKEIAKRYRVNRINGMMRMYLRGDVTLENNAEFDQLFLDTNGIPWNRQFTTNNFDPSELKDALDNKDCSYMVVGHTPQMYEGINLKKGLIWCVDTGMSKAFGANNHLRLQALEIINNGETVNIIK
jgi:hypothetical protein